MANTNRLIAGVDLRSQENNRAHRTEEIDRKRLIVRRGHAFSLTVHLFHPLQSGHELALVLKQDAVYFPDESLLEEYIMNENGRIFRGSADWMSGMPWNFGQFEDNVMDICFEILDRFKPARSDPPNDMRQRWDPVYISRAVVAMVNANDDGGVLAGKWQEPYTGGVQPTKWMSSVPILEKWSKSKSGVKYGQCWVFAAVACTVLRCLGIPTRCITNFESAHDTDGNLSIDRVYNMHRENDDHADSIWNFHCWIESYMQREDLPEGYGGWQVLDPTPQERSSGMFRCGPCPLKAIKEGDLNVKFDVPFVFAEVNADIINWEIRPDGQRKQLSSNSAKVGRNISTKSPYSNEREDITHQYKYQEGSAKEREVYNKAGRCISGPDGEEESKPANEPGKVQLEIKHAQPVFGTDFDVIFELENMGDEEVSCKLNMMSEAVTYSSVHLGWCQNSTVNVVIPAHKVHRETVRLLYTKYASVVSEHNIIRVIGVARVSGQEKSILEMVNIPLSKPKLSIKVPGWVILNRKITTLISFTNPLPVPLNRGVFTVEGAGLLSTKEFRISGSIAPGQRVSVELSFTPMRAGVREFLVDFDSDRLQDVKGVATLVVRKTPPSYSSKCPVICG
ncbi:protein-glutamine gamma-glutamyltransferase 2-like isoform X5 [Gadus macrocephalus]|uniref:protein-glutamine gamma-glutamyltransferase 2-like isoform X5 n=1 Tax=Gadus macrocephalus TaxID=80720 RepID=UPI0028CB76AF|nr:protein-glutamine gamma-glutamyltransferase 2-like isoform X5 [Gadus macrocephalus]